MKWTHTVGLALVLFGILAGLTVYKKSLNPYLGFAEAQRTDSVVQVHGTLNPGSSTYDGSALRFAMHDEKGLTLKVVFTDTKPGNFDQARDIVAIGRYQGGEFHASKLLVKCPSKYQEMQQKQTAAQGKA